MASYLMNMFNNARNNIKNYFQSNDSISNEKNVIQDELPKGITYANFIHERVITDDIKIGVLNKGSTLVDSEYNHLKYTNQGICYKNQYYNLIQAKNEDTKLIYNFRGLYPTDNITLELTLKNSDIYCSLYNYNSSFETGYINNIIRKTYKTINFDSKEIDWIFELFNKN